MHLRKKTSSNNCIVIGFLMIGIQIIIKFITCKLMCAYSYFVCACLCVCVCVILHL